MVLFGSLLGLVTPDNKGDIIAYLFLSQAGFDWGLYLSIAITQMGVDYKNLRGLWNRGHLCLSLLQDVDHKMTNQVGDLPQGGYFDQTC